MIKLDDNIVVVTDEMGSVQYIFNRFDYIIIRMIQMNNKVL